MDIGPLVPTRLQLSKFLGNNAQLIITMEQLFQKAGILTPIEINILTVAIQEAAINAQTAMSNAIEAQAALESIAQSLSLIASSPASQQQGLQDDFMPGHTHYFSSDDLAPVVQIGTLGTQQADSVDITGGTVNAQMINNQTILIQSSSALTNGAGALLGTLANSPVAGNPTKWVPINDNGTTRYIPTW